MLTTQKGPWMYYLCLSLEILYFPSSLYPLTLILLTWRIWWAPNNASKWQLGINSAFKGLIPLQFMNRGKEKAMYFLSDKHAGLADRRQRTLGGRTPETSNAILVSRGISWRGVSISEPSQDKTAKGRVSRTSICEQAILDGNAEVTVPRPGQCSPCHMF